MKKFYIILISMVLIGGLVFGTGFYVENQIIKPLNKQSVQGEQGEKGDKGDVGEQGPKGDTGEQGEKGDNGINGLTPYIGENGNWFIGTYDTGISAQGSVSDKSYIEKTFVNYGEAANYFANNWVNFSHLSIKQNFTIAGTRLNLVDGTYSSTNLIIPSANFIQCDVRTNTVGDIQTFYFGFNYFNSGICSAEIGLHANSMTIKFSYNECIMYNNTFYSYYATASGLDLSNFVFTFCE